MAWKPAVIAGITSMKMISSTSITSIIGVTFGDAFTPELPADIAMSQRSPPLLRDWVVSSSRRGVELARETGATKLAGARDVLDHIVDHFLRRISHLGREVVDLDLEVVEEPHRRNRDDETERGGDQRFRHTRGDRGKTTGTGRSHCGEGVHDSHRGAEQSD